VRILRTGDLFRLRPDGMAELCGRKDRQVKIRGVRVDPGEVEAALRRCEGVADAVVVARRESNTASALVAFVVAHPWAVQLDNKALSARLAAQMRPAVIRLIEEIPRLPSFKPDLAALATLDIAYRTAEDTANPARVAPTASRIDPRVHDAVKRAWTTACGARAVVRDLSWEEAGGDSLRALELLLLLEESLGRRLSTEMLSAGTTPSGLCAAVERRISESSEDAAHRGADDGRIPVFLMPGGVHEGPGLARVRHALRDRVRFVLINYPDWRETIAAKADFDAIVTATVGQILSRCGDRPIQLAGYSFGGFVAFETAHRLVESGHRVTFLGLLDTRRWSQFESSLPTTGVKSVHLVGKIRESFSKRDVGISLRRIFRTLLELRAFVLLEAFAWFCMSVAGRRAAANTRMQLLTALRSYALRGWLPSALSVPTFFFRSVEDTAHLPYDCGWSALCSPFTVVPIGGDHISMMEPTHVEHLCASFLEALYAAPVCAGGSIDAAEPHYRTLTALLPGDDGRRPEAAEARTYLSQN
jgi:thioesterase domain-containing protein